MTRDPGPAAAPRQLALPLPELAPAWDPAELIEDASNAEALAWLRRPEAWPGGRLALFGPPSSGKSLLLRWAAARHGGWAVREGPRLAGLPEPPRAGGGIALDDADLVAEERALLHLVNLCAEARVPLLLAGRAPPARWPVRLPDLASRLRGTAAVAVQPPGDALLDALLAKHFADRQLRVEAGLRAWLLARLPREAAAVAEAAARLDRAALAAGGRISRALARAALAGWPGFDALAPEAPGSRDVSMAGGEAPSPCRPALL